MERRVLSISAARFADSLGGGMAYFTLPILIGAIAHSSMPVDTLSGIVISTWGLLATIFQPVAGKVIERKAHPKWFLFSSLFLTAILVMLYTRVRSVEELVVLRALLGIVESFLMVSSLTLLMHFAGRKKGESFGIYNTFTDLGFSASPVLAGTLIAMGIDVVFYISALLVLVSAIAVAIFVEDAGDVSVRGRSGGILDLGRETVPVLLSLSAAVALMSSIVPLENSFMERLSITPFEFGLSFTLYLTTRTVFNTFAGRITDRKGAKRVYFLSSILLSFTALLFLVRSFPVFLAVRFIQGFVVALVYTSSAVYVAERSGLSYAMSMSVLSSVITAGLTLGPLVAGFLSGYLGFEIAYILFSAMVATPIFYEMLKEGTKKKGLPAPELVVLP
ncbi:MFS transporter [Geoglobus ahangari]|uniref:MFS transporter n=1 Tax=Geoglobus ahangari TaxID=113653 RepID=UPI00064E1CC0|nr:MFS transporter [Geoglobus ahangari]